MPQPFAYPLVGSAAMRGTGVAVRTAQTFGIEWLDLGKQTYDDLSATLERVAAAPNPVEALTLQAAFAQRSLERWLARSAVFGDLIAASLAEVLRASPGPWRAGGPRREP